jgi:hypothetical protein
VTAATVVREVTRCLLVFCLLFCEMPCKGYNVVVDLLLDGCGALPVAIGAVGSHGEVLWCYAAGMICGSSEGPVW